MQKEGKPKKQSEKCEVAGTLVIPRLFLHYRSPTGQISRAIIAKRLPKNGEYVSGFG
jgi:hypothetical protein